MIERAQFASNNIIYEKEGILPDYPESFMYFLLSETEKIHSRVRRFTAPDEHPFSTNLPEPFSTKMNYEWPIKRTTININDKIMSIYIEKMIPLMCKIADDGNYGSSAVSDVNVLQALSKRIHYGKFVAESKFLRDEKDYTVLIKAKDENKIYDLLTDIPVEEQVLNRVEIKASTYGQDPLSKIKEYKIRPDVIRDIYYNWVIPLTKEVEIKYLMERL
jgi:chorismate mutase